MCITCNVQTHLFPTSMNLNQDAAGKTEWHFCYFAGNELSDATLIESISYSPNTISTCMKHFHGMQVTPVFVLLLVSLLCLKWSQTLKDPLQSRTLKDRAHVTTVEAAFVCDFLTLKIWHSQICSPICKSFCNDYHAIIFQP